MKQVDPLDPSEVAPTEWVALDNAVTLLRDILDNNAE